MQSVPRITRFLHNCTFSWQNIMVALDPEELNVHPAGIFTRKSRSMQKSLETHNTQ